MEKLFADADTVNSVGDEGHEAKRRSIEVNGESGDGDERPANDSSIADGDNPAA